MHLCESDSTSSLEQQTRGFQLGEGRPLAGRRQGFAGVMEDIGGSSLAGAAGPSARLSVKAILSEDYQRRASEGLTCSSGSRAGGLGDEGT